MSFKQGCSKCGGEIVGVEYHWSVKEHYDGVSEFMCLKCKRRVGRWSNIELKTGEFEKPFNYGTEKQNV